MGRLRRAAVGIIRPTICYPAHIKLHSCVSQLWNSTVTVMKEGVSHASYDWDSKLCATQKVKNQTAVPRIYVYLMLLK